MNTHTSHKLNIRLPSTMANRKPSTDECLQLKRRAAHLKSKIAWQLAAYLIEDRESQLSLILRLQEQYAATLHSLEILGG